MTNDTAGPSPSAGSRHATWYGPGARTRAAAPRVVATTPSSPANTSTVAGAPSLADASTWTPSGIARTAVASSLAAVPSHVIVSTAAPTKGVGVGVGVRAGVATATEVVAAAVAGGDGVAAAAQPVSRNVTIRPTRRRLAVRFAPIAPPLT